jgi:ankyrin repeat protein
MNEMVKAVLKKYQKHPEFLGIELIDVNQRGAVDDAPLHMAARLGDISDLNILVASGADINMPGDLGNTPLHNAALTGKVEAIERLLALGADAALQNEFSETPLRIAQLGNHHEAIVVLQRANKRVLGWQSPISSSLFQLWWSQE